MGLGLGIINEPLEYPTGWLPTENGLIDFIKLWLQGGVDVAVNAWKDSSNMQVGATQTLSGNAPTLIGTTPEGLRFDQSGIPQYMDFPEHITIDSGSAFTLALVVKLDSTVNQTLLSDSSNEFIEILNNKKFRIKTNNPSNVTTVLTASTAAFNASLSIIFLARQVNGRFHWRVNGKRYFPDDTQSTNTTNTGGFDIKNLASRNDSDRFLTGHVREVIIWDDICLGIPEHQTKMVNLHRYLADKFDITLELTDLIP